MRTFPQAVEQWRGTVLTAIADLFKKFPSKKTLIDALGSTIDDLSDVILAIIETESSGNASATGDSGNSIGLMQLNYGSGTPQGAGFTGSKDDLFNPYINCYWGINVFLNHLATYGDYEQAILAYNAGSIRSSSAGTPVNLDYLYKVLGYLSEKKISFLPASWRTWYGDIIAGRGRSTIVEFDPHRIKPDPAGELEKNVIHITKKSIAIAGQSQASQGGISQDPPAAGRLSLWKRIVLFLARKVFPIS
jgi:hypothetical protein